MLNLQDIRSARLYRALPVHSMRQAASLSGIFGAINILLNTPCVNWRDIVEDNRMLGSELNMSGTVRTNQHF